MLGIIGAMEEEVEELRGCMTEVSVMETAGMRFCRGSLRGTEAVVVRSGIGKVNAGICTQILADRFAVDAVINTGIAGSLSPEIHIGDIVLSTDAVQHDMDATGFGYPKGQIPRVDTLAFAADPRLRQLAKDCCRKVAPELGVFEGRVVSGDQFISDRRRKDLITEEFHGLCTEMEGAAIGQAAYLNRIPFLIIRAISDNADDTAGIDYEIFEKQAIRNSVRLLLAMAEQYRR